MSVTVCCIKILIFFPNMSEIYVYIKEDIINCWFEQCSYVPAIGHVSFMAHCISTNVIYIRPGTSEPLFQMMPGKVITLYEWNLTVFLMGQ